MNKKCLIGAIVLSPVVVAVFLAVLFVVGFVLQWVSQTFPLFPWIVMGFFVAILLCSSGYVLYAECKDWHEKRALEKLRRDVTKRENHD